MKRIWIMVLLSFLLFCPSYLWAMSEVPQNAPILKIDSNNELRLPKNFRTTNELTNFTNSPPSIVGLAELHESGSAQFSEEEFTQILTKMSGKIIIVDLRQESHGFLDGTAVSWYGKRNWANLGKSLGEVEIDEQARLHAALTYPIDMAPFNGDKKINNALTEEQLVSAYGVQYFRIPVTDHMPPSIENVDEFVQFYKGLPQNAWLHFHCHAGHGRTTTFMAMYDILRNGKKVSFEDIMSRQALLGDMDLREVPLSKKAWERDLYEKRAIFIKQFYDYVTQSPDDLPVMWSQRIQQHQ
jgi:hypothetical protein